MFAHTGTDLYRLPDNGSALCRRAVKDTTSLSSFVFEDATSTFFTVTRTGTDVALSATAPTSDLLVWWLGEFVHPSSHSQASALLAQTFGSVDQATRDAAVAALASKTQLAFP
ncbi:MAG TPA: hypothetical protein VM661_06920 [Candidatus Sulfotelmatobacter sp.]|jgi:hypothetical protein|nr:hypothetical protein [Candidatus Sulfotelmatobacter sp.]